MSLEGGSPVGDGVMNILHLKGVAESVCRGEERDNVCVRVVMAQITYQ